MKRVRSLLPSDLLIRHEDVAANLRAEHLFSTVPAHLRPPIDDELSRAARLAANGDGVKGVERGLGARHGGQYMPVWEYVKKKSHRNSIVRSSSAIQSPLAFELCG
jgi:hypothetical protein